MEDRSFYVYAHYRLDTMEPFYIGKGRNGRKDILGRNSIHDNISEKHGHAVVVLYDNLTEEEAFFYEREVIEDLVFNEGYEIPCKNCGEFTKKFSYLTNFSFGGEGQTGHILNEETKKRISIATKNRYKDPKEREKVSIAGKKRFENESEREKQSIAIKKRFEDPKARKKISVAVKKSHKDPKVRKKISIAGKKRFKDPKEREKQSIAIKTSWENPEIKEKISAAIKKSYKDPKVREKVSKSAKKRFEDPKERERIREKLSGEKSYKAKSVYCNELNILFSYIKIAEKYCINILNIKIGPISSVCDGKRKSTGKLADGIKLTWSWLENVDKEILDKAEFIDSKKYEELLSKNVNDCK